MWSFFTSLKNKGCSSESPRRDEIARSGFFMGCPWEIRIHGPGADPEAIREAFREVERLELLLSRFRPETEISRINRWDGRSPIRIHPEVYGVLRTALRVAACSHGAFDPTLGNFRRIRLHPTEPVLLSKPEGACFDLGAIGKGYGVDRAVSLLKAAGVSSGRVSTGSTACAWGNSPDGNAWRFGIRKPGDPEGIMQSVPVRDGAISSSGDYEQSGHIRDPRSGWTVKSPGSVTVLAATATEADALSTAAFVLGTKKGSGFLESLKEAEGLFVGIAGAGRIHSTSGWPGSPEGGLSRRGFLAGLAASAALILITPLTSFAKVYLTPENALRKVLPDAEDFEEVKVSLIPDQKEKLRELLGKKTNGGDYTIYRGIRSGSREAVGYGVVVDVIGKERPITFMVGVGPGNRITGVEVMTYRESRGFEIRSKRFRKQFRGISLEDPLKMGQDFYGISGATLSCRSTAFAVRKALALTQVLYGVGGS